VGLGTVLADASQKTCLLIMTSKSFTSVPVWTGGWGRILYGDTVRHGRKISHGAVSNLEMVLVIMHFAACFDLS
jgi:hypothetical protein